MEVWLWAITGIMALIVIALLINDAVKEPVVINGKSTGLGLAIARTLVEQMNGTISAKYYDNKLSICVSFWDIKI